MLVEGFVKLREIFRAVARYKKEIKVTEYCFYLWDLTMVYVSKNLRE